MDKMVTMWAILQEAVEPPLNRLTTEGFWVEGSVSLFLYSAAGLKSIH